MNIFEFSYELSYDEWINGGTNQITEFKYFPNELFDFLWKADFDEIKIDFALGWWKESIQHKILLDSKFTEEEKDKFSKDSVLVPTDFDVHEPGVTFTIQTPVKS